MLTVRERSVIYSRAFLILDIMRTKILIICLFIAVLAAAFFASPSLAMPGSIPIVQGQVIDQNKSLLAGANVTIEDGSYHQIASMVTDSRGNFSFTNVSDGGTGRVRVGATYVEYGKIKNTTTKWYPSNNSVTDLQIIIQREYVEPATDGSTHVKTNLPFTALGQVTDANGQPVAGAEVIIYDGIYQVIGVTTTDREGNFNFTNVVANSPGCKVTVSYKTGDKTYQKKLSETLWYPTDEGIIKFNQMDTQLTDYPRTTGFVWGTITDSAGNLLSGVIYLTDGAKNLSIETFESKTYVGFNSRVPVGTYTAYAEHTDASGTRRSKPTRIEVQPTTDYLDTNSVTFMADQPVPTEIVQQVATAITTSPSPSVSTPSPFNSPVILMMALIGAVMWLRRKSSS